MYLRVENLKALASGINLNAYQKSLAKKELERLFDLIKDMEKDLNTIKETVK